MVKPGNAFATAATSPQPKPIAPVTPTAKSIPPPTSQVESESRGGRYLGAVAIVCFLLAASFLIKLAIDSGWLTPLRQLTAAAVFGFVLVAVGYSMRGKDARYASMLPGAGIVVLFMCVYGGHLYYHLYGAGTAAILAGLVSFFSIGLFRLFQHDFFVLAAVIGSYLIPLYMGGRGDYDPRAVSTYFLFWDIVFAVLAIGLRSRAVIALASYFALGGFFMVIVSHGIRRDHPLLLFSATFQALQFLILAVSVGFYSYRNKQPLSTKEAWKLFPVLLFFYALEYALIREISPDYASWLGLAFAGFIYLLYFISKTALKRTELDSFPMVAGFIAIVLFQCLYLDILSSDFTPWVAIFLLCCLPALGRRGISFAEAAIPFCVVLAVIAMEFLRSLSSGPGLNAPRGVLLVNLCFAGALFLAYVPRKAAPGLKQSDFPFFILSLASSQALVGLRRIALKVAGASTQEFFVSGVWAAFALAMIVIALKTKDKVLAHTALAIFSLVSLKVLFSDIASTTSLSRVIALIFVGALMYAGGYLLRKIERWSGTNP